MLHQHRTGCPPAGRPRGVARPRPPPGPPSPQPSTLPGQAQSSLASQLATLLRAPVIDETGLDETLALDLRWEPGNRQDLISTLEEEVGLELTPEVQAVEMVIIRSEPRPDPSA